MQEAIGERRCQVPTISGPLGWIRGGHYLDRSGEKQVAHPALEGHTQHGGLDSWRRGRQFVEEEIASLGRLQSLCPGGWLQAHTVVGDHRETGEVAGLSQGADDCLARNVVGRGGGLDQG